MIRRIWTTYILLCLMLAFLIGAYMVATPPSTRVEDPTRIWVIWVVVLGLILIALSLIFQSRTFFQEVAVRFNKWINSTALKINTALRFFPPMTVEYWLGITTKKQMLGGLMYVSLILFVPLALIQLYLYPVLVDDSTATWLLYWVYLFFGVILPGMLLIVRYTSWQMDWLAWVGLGWAVGHGLELISLLIARSLNMSGLFIIWIPVAYLMFFVGQADWSGKVKPLSNNIQICLAFVVLFGIGAFQYYDSNQILLGSLPYAIEDTWFHSENAVEFRDHAVMQDPRLAGEPFNYHNFSYAPAAAASLVTGDWLANLMIRYVGLNSVWLVTLLMFNTSRILFENRIMAAALGTFVFLLPIDFMSQLSARLDSGGAITAYGLYRSNSTLGGYIFLVGLALPLLWFYYAPRRRDSWIIVLMAFVGSGTKVMLGPLLLCAGLGMIGWGMIFRWRRKSTTDPDTYSLKTSFAALGLLLVPVLVVSVGLIFGQGSYSEAIKWVYSSFGSHTPIYPTLLATAPSADIVIRTLWIFTFAPVILLGATLTTFFGRKNRILSTYAALVWTIFAASLVPTMTIELVGFSQLFFIYYGLCILSTLAGYGLIVLFKSVVYSPIVRIRVVGGLLICLMIAQIFWPSPPIALVGASFGSIWPSEKASSLQTSLELRSYVGKYFVLTDEMRDALSWARHHLSKDDVFVVNNVGPALYAVYSEHRAFNETTSYTPANLTDKALLITRYGWRNQLIEDWIAGKPDVLIRMKQAGITYIFVDRLNGPVMPNLPSLPPPAYENRDFIIYPIP